MATVSSADDDHAPFCRCPCVTSPVNVSKPHKSSGKANHAHTFYSPCLQCDKNLQIVYLSFSFLTTSLPLTFLQLEAKECIEFPGGLGRSPYNRNYISCTSDQEIIKRSNSRFVRNYSNQGPISKILTTPPILKMQRAPSHVGRRILDATSRQCTPKTRRLRGRRLRRRLSGWLN